MFWRKKTKENLDIDVRFLLANERTLLAWVRTGLTLIAGGVALAFIAPEAGYGTVAGLGAIGFGGLMTMIGYLRYYAADKAIRSGELPPVGGGGLMVVVGVMAFSILLVIVKQFNIIS